MTTSFHTTAILFIIFQWQTITLYVSYISWCKLVFLPKYFLRKKICAHTYNHIACWLLGRTTEGEVHSTCNRCCAVSAYSHGKKTCLYVCMKNYLEASCNCSHLSLLVSWSIIGILQFPLVLGWYEGWDIFFLFIFSLFFLLKILKFRVQVTSQVDIAFTYCTRL